MDRQAREQGVTKPSMKLQDNHLSRLLLDNISMNSCWILPEAQREGRRELESLHPPHTHHNETGQTTLSFNKHPRAGET